MKSSKRYCACHELMENKLEWIKNLMSLHSQNLKLFFHSEGNARLKQELMLLAAVKVGFNEYFKQDSN